MKKLCVITKRTAGDNTLLAISSNPEAYIQSINETNPLRGSYELISTYDVEDDFPYNQFIDALADLFPYEHNEGHNFIINPDNMISFLNKLSDINGLLKQRSDLNEKIDDESDEENSKIVYDDRIDGDTDSELFESSSRLTKKDCADILRDNGFHINETLTLSSLNKNGKYYWSNAPVEYLNEDWSLMLNDTENHILYLFEIKANTIDPTKMTLRKGEGREHCMQLEFVYENKDFLEYVSGVKFAPYLVGQVQYGPKAAFKITTETETRSYANEGETITKTLEEINLSDISYGAQIKSFEFEGTFHVVKENREMIDYIFNYLYQEDPSLFRKSAHSNGLIKYFYFGTPNEDEIEYYNKMEGIDIYYKSEIANTQIRKGILAIKRFFGKTKFNKPLSSLTITMNYGTRKLIIDLDDLDFDW